MLSPHSPQQPKVVTHSYSCGRSGYACVDCGRQFDGASVKAHNSCVTEHDKYAKGATKPGGFASGGFYGDGEGGQGAAGPAAPAAAAAGAASAPQPVGLEFLASRPPWACSACGVTCTSQDTLLGHAAGAKHRRRSNAAAKAAKKEGKKGGVEAEAAAPATPAAVPAVVEAAAAEPPSKKAAAAVVVAAKKKKEPKWKKLGVAALQKAGRARGLKVRALLAAVGVAAGDAAAKAAALAAWKGSSRFVVDGKRVGLKV